MCSDKRVEEIRKNNGNHSKQANIEINKTLERFRKMDEETMRIIESILP